MIVPHASHCTQQYCTVEQGVALTERNTTGPPCSRGLEAAWRHRLACADEAACRPAVARYRARQTTDVDDRRRRQTPATVTIVWSPHTMCRRASNNQPPATFRQLNHYANRRRAFDTLGMSGATSSSSAAVVTVNCYKQTPTFADINKLRRSYCWQRQSCFQFSLLFFHIGRQAEQRRIGLRNSGHRTLRKMWVNTFVVRGVHPRRMILNSF